MRFQRNSPSLWVTLGYALSLLGTEMSSLLLTLGGTLKILERHFSELPLYVMPFSGLAL